MKNNRTVTSSESKERGVGALIGPRLGDELYHSSCSSMFSRIRCTGMSPSALFITCT